MLPHYVKATLVLPGLKTQSLLTLEIFESV